jgi:hypothetical protein
MENLTDKEKKLLKYLFQIGAVMVSSSAEILLYDDDYNSFMFSDLWNLATKFEIDI